MSPERLLGEQYDASGDIWSVGIMMVQLWTKKYPFEDNISTPIDLLTELEGLHIDRLLSDNKFPRSMGKVVRAMMASDPVDRASCMELLEFAWFQESRINNITDAQKATRFTSDAVLLALFFYADLGITYAKLPYR